MNENKQLPKCPNLPEEIISELECYIQTIETLLSTLGLKCFQPLENINAKKKIYYLAPINTAILDMVNTRKKVCYSIKVQSAKRFT